MKEKTSISQKLQKFGSVLAGWLFQISERLSDLV